MFVGFMEQHVMSIFYSIRTSCRKRFLQIIFLLRVMYRPREIKGEDIKYKVTCEERECFDGSEERYEVDGRYWRQKGHNCCREKQRSQVLFVDVHCFICQPNLSQWNTELNRWMMEFAKLMCIWTLLPHLLLETIPDYSQ